MVGRLTENEFNKALENIRVGKQTRDIAYGVLVQGKAQVEFVRSTGLSKGAVSQAVNRVYDAALKVRQESAIPPGHKVVTAVLPESQAFQVEKWAKEAAARQKGKKR